MMTAPRPRWRFAEAVGQSTIVARRVRLRAGHRWRQGAFTARSDGERQGRRQKGITKAVSAQEPTSVDRRQGRRLRWPIGKDRPQQRQNITPDPFLSLLDSSMGAESASDLLASAGLGVYGTRGDMSLIVVLLRRDTR
ncbi:hypothetical protein C8Q77DRAFT_110044 [Trametes polyzona]|nr:hypothetical protein C8Q77DRAFT_110044 [Trametes polyzona]